MIGEVAFVTLDADVGDVARRLAATPTGAVIVVNATRRPSGIITRSDIERAAAETDARPLPRWLIKNKGTVATFRPPSRPLHELMTSPAISVSDEAQVLELVPLIERKRLKSIPVVNRDGLVGLVRRTDVLRAIDDAGRAVAPRAGGLTAQQFRELAAQRQAQENAQRAKARRLAQEAQKKLIDELAQRRLSDRAWTDMIAGARRAASASLKEYV
ncbi:MAG: HPP family protein, partial [Roseiarcus sp.]